jgi:glycosyltransferase involved in cell wall biosynthesis
VRIAQVAPLYESVPPRYYGGTERVVSYLTEALVKLGHEVTLYASGDSITQATLRPGCKRSLRLDKTSTDPLANHIYLAEQVFQEAADFDIVHSHIDYIAFPLLRRMATPRVTTLHGRLDITNLVELFREFREEPIISISRHQRLPLAWANWQATVPHGITEDLYSFQPTPGAYLAFLGRVSPEKRLDRAIRIALRAGMPLKIAAKVDRPDRDYFNAKIKPLLRNRDIEFIGEIGEGEKNEFLGNAYALLFPIDWPEPFGLVMIEAMACGTPVIACPCGSVPEIVDPGINGFLAKDVSEAVRAVKSVAEVNRAGCRQAFEARFSATRMARDYTAIFEMLIQSQQQASETRAEVL